MTDFGKAFELFNPAALTSFWTSFGRPAEFAAPALKTVTTTNRETMRLANQRTRAYMALPGQLSQCRKPEDVVELQIRFWQDAMRDYQAGAETIGEAWRIALEPLTQAAAGGASAERDYLSVREAEQEDGKRASRRAA
jgi:hypothetical protein